MFDLDREVTTWSAAANAARCRPAAGIAEMKDHLYCEIDRARAEGMPDEQAFRTAIARLGSATDLTAETAKNRSALGDACQVVARLDGPLPSADHRRLLIVHALVWAALMIATSLVLKKTAGPEVSSWLLIGILIPLWLASDLVLRSVLRRRSGGSTPTSR